MINAEHKYFVPVAVVVCMTLLVFAVYISQSGVRPEGPMAALPTVPPMPTSPDGLLHNVVGTITAVGSGTITMQGTLPGTSKPASLTVGINSSTAITMQTPKDQQTFQKEMQSRSASSTPPMPFTSKTIAAADLLVGMFVVVTPVANVKQEATSFEATGISAQAIMTPPPTMVPPGASSSTPPLL